MRYFVTGATGFIGGHLTSRLLDLGHEVTALVRNPEKARDLERRGVEITEGDITKKETMREGMSGADGVFHVAAWYKVGAEDPSVAEDINVKGTRNVLELMEELKIQKGVYTSTVAVFSDTGGEMVDEDYMFRGRFLSEYERTKWEAHYRVARPMMLNRGLPLVIVQPSVVYGPGDNSSTGRMLDAYLKRELPAKVKGTYWGWTHVEDIARGHVLAMERGKKGESYIIAGEKRSMIDALRIAESITGIAPPRITLTPTIVKLMSRMASIIQPIHPLPNFYHPESLRVIAGVSYLGSNRKAKSQLGYDPMGLEEGFRKYLPLRMEELGIEQGN